MPTPTLVPACARMPSAIARATGSLTAPCSAISASARRAARSWRGCCSRPRRGRRSRSCPAHRSAATPAGRRCTTRRPRSSSPSTRSSIADDRLERPAVGAVERSAEHAAAAARPPRRARRRPRRALVAARGQMQLDLSEHRENRRGDRDGLRRPGAVDRLRRRVDVRFGPAGDLQHAPEQPGAAGARREALAHDRLEHRLHLARRAGQQHERRAAVLEPEPGRGAVRVRRAPSRRAAPSPAAG